MDERAFLLLESGARIHTTEYTREKEKMPSGFAAKLRKVRILRFCLRF